VEYGALEGSIVRGDMKERRTTSMMSQVFRSMIRRTCGTTLSQARTISPFMSDRGDDDLR
jgi:hypothetical protein